MLSVAKKKFEEREQWSQSDMVGTFELSDQKFKWTTITMP